MATIGLPLGFERLNSFPLDPTSTFQTLAALQTYASSNNVAYSGQICSVTENNKAYIITADKGILEIGSGSFDAHGFATSGDLSGYYPIDNPSGYLTADDLVGGFPVEDLVYTTGDQSIDGYKNFTGSLSISGNNVIASNGSVFFIYKISETDFANIGTIEPKALYFIYPDG